MRALILSAGFGERLKPYTLKRAKPAIEFLNVPMLAFPYHWLSTLDLSDVVFNLHHLPDTVREAAIHTVDPRTHLHFSHEHEILGSGGGIWNARFDLRWDDEFAVANADGVVAFEESDTLERMLKFHRERNALATLLVCPHEGVGTRIPGVWLDKYGEVGNFGKAPTKDYLECWHYASYMILSRRIWRYLPEGESNILYDALEPRIAQGEKVLGFTVENMRWFETGNSADYLASTKACLEILRTDTRMGMNLRELVLAKSRFQDMHLISESALVARDAAFDGIAVVGAGASIGAGARLTDCVVLGGANVAPGSIHKNAILL